MSDKNINVFVGMLIRDNVTQEDWKVCDIEGSVVRVAHVTTGGAWCRTAYTYEEVCKLLQKGTWSKK